MLKIITTFIFLTGLFFFSCNTTEPDNKPADFEFAAEDASCTEAWIKLKADNIKAAQVFREDSLIYSFNSSSIDTVLYDEGLLPNQSYKYKLTIQHPLANGNNSAVNKELTLQTMDTTSHNFTWQTFTFGQHSSSVLYDVAIINENNIWAVGEIYMNDSLGNPDPHAYNAVHWDGIKWDLIRINTQSDCNPVTYAPLRAIWAFSDSNIIITSGGSIGWFNGKTNKADCNIRPMLTGSINKIWGTSSSDLYVVGNGGNIAHYDGSPLANGWTKIESGTELDFLDIYGATDSKTNEQQILAVCTRNYPLGKAIFQLEGNIATQITSTPIQWELFSCWFVPNRHYYVIGSGIYEKSSLSDSVWRNEALDITHYGTSRIRGNAINDFFVVGAYGEILHYNGFNWKSFLPELGSLNGSYGSVDIKGNLVVITGFDAVTAKITIGIR